jgi:hypothetical protein
VLLESVSVADEFRGEVIGVRNSKESCREENCLEGAAGRGAAGVCILTTAANSKV